MAAPSSRSSATVSLPPALASLLTCRAAATAGERCAHFRIRHQVFVIEQGLFRRPDGTGDDTDAHDDDPATIHVVGLAGETICGTVRLYPLPPAPRKRDPLPLPAPPRPPPPRP